MFHARIDDEDKQTILKSLLMPDGTCRVVFCTIAFGMGVDVPNIRTVIHYGPSMDVDDYFQESGRAGRDGKASEAVIFHYPGCLLGHVSKKMKEYCKLSNDRCRRSELLSHFPSSRTDSIHLVPKHLCCDHCTMLCTCDDEPQQLFSLPSLQKWSQNSQPSDELDTRHVSPDQRTQLKERLLGFWQEVLDSIADSDCSVSDDTKLESILASTRIDSIVESCHYIFSVEDLEEICIMWNYSIDVMEIIDEILD